MRINRWVFAGQQCLDPLEIPAEYEAKAPLDRCNSFTWDAGKEPSIGYLLLDKGSLDKIKDQSQSIHQLLIVDGAGFIVFKRLAIIAAEAVLASGPRETIKTFTKTADSTPYVLTVADPRHYARLAQINLSACLRDFKLDIRTITPTPKELVDRIWETLKPHFGKDLSWKVADTDWTKWDPDEPESGSQDMDIPAPEGWKFHGVSAWDALWMVLDEMAWDFRLTPDGNPVIFDPEPPPNGFDEFIAKATVLDTLASDDPLTMPHDLALFAPRIDAQWDEGEVGTDGRRTTITPQEYNETRQWHRIDIPVDTVISRLADEPTFLEGLTADGLKTQSDRGTLQIFGSVPLLVNDQNKQLNKTLVENHLIELGRRRVQYLLRRGRTSWWISGLVTKLTESEEVLLPASRFSRIVYESTVASDGIIRTVLTQLPMREFTQRDVRPKLEERRIVVRLPEFLPDAVNPGEKITVQVQKGSIVSGELRWTDAGLVDVYNGTSGPLSALIQNTRVEAWWVHQVGRGGAWVILAAGGAGEGGEGGVFPHTWVAASRLVTRQEVISGQLQRVFDIECKFQRLLADGRLIESTYGPCDPRDVESWEAPESVAIPRSPEAGVRTSIAVLIRDVAGVDEFIRTLLENHDENAQPPLSTTSPNPHILVAPANAQLLPGTVQTEWIKVQPTRRPVGIASNLPFEIEYRLLARSDGYLLTIRWQLDPIVSGPNRGPFLTITFRSPFAIDLDDPLTPPRQVLELLSFQPPEAPTITAGLFNPTVIVNPDPPDFFGLGDRG